ncbi:type II/IV secretion system ATPase subunit [Methanocella arvoryzae]|uniref:Bacterial type II secretion system protein n=1 Tax=Methanocella arvoryzae (strain DSM 22066 / NBRC 105507 / MRE50) TaxID=351160 RepID=Q0W849_METAR|nr:type II/IV secretion system ATPase subunit [Methanocella arvoryzae]CAJ35444.1 putative bacterial type II secretion system protein [Methanocella arvoryzae MRE50]
MVEGFTLPFEANRKPVDHDHSDLNQCGIYRILPEEGKREAEKNPYLLDYLHMIPIDEIGMPKIYPKLDRKLGELKTPNLIYPAGDEIYIHIYPDMKDVRNYYIPVEQHFIVDIGPYLPIVEERLVDMVAKFNPTSLEERKEILRECLAKICVIDDKKKQKTATTVQKKSNFPFAGLFGSKEKAGLKTVTLTKNEYRAVEYYVMREKVGMGLLEPVIKDPNIEDITCDGYGPIFLEHKVFKGLKTTVEFTNKDLNKFVLQLSEKIGKPITFASPIVDATLPDGSRINIVYGDDVSKRGSNFTIRKFSDKPLSLLTLIDGGSLDYTMAAYLWIMLQEGMSAFVSGETASGKTTLLNAMMAFIPPNAKIVSIEDTAEVQAPHKNWTREITRGAGKGMNMSDVGMFDLLKAALRQRPNYIIVGEIRGVEGAIAFQAIQTGHPVLSTFHAASVEKLIQRLTGDPINVPKTYVDNLNLVIIQSAVRRPDGRIVRRVLSINEIVGYNPQTKGLSFVEAFAWDPVTDTHSFKAYGSSYLLEQKIARKLGIPQTRTKLIYDELEKRAKILKKIGESGIRDYAEFFSMITQVERKGLTKMEV